MSIVTAREGFKEAMIGLINGSELPFFVVSDVMRQILADVDIMARRQYELELAQERAKKANDNEPEVVYDDKEE